MRTSNIQDENEHNILEHLLAVQPIQRYFSYISAKAKPNKGSLEKSNRRSRYYQKNGSTHTIQRTKIYRKRLKENVVSMNKRVKYKIKKMIIRNKQNHREKFYRGLNERQTLATIIE